MNRNVKAARVDELEFRELVLTLSALRIEHRKLDAEINYLSDNGIGDQVTMMRLKKRKLRLRDEMQAIEDAIVPDMIA